jgi:hypothetical protein
MNYLISLFISSLLGFLGLNVLRSQTRIDPILHIIASIGLGLALSAQIIFYTLFIVGHYNPTALWIGHGIGFVILIAANFFVFKKDHASLFPKFPSDQIAWIGFGTLSLILIPLWREAHFYPFGGWDAWACWNLKAKFIFLGGDNWKNMLDPSMWRSNNQYPFLLPLMNVWGWNFYKDPSVTVPILNAILFTFLTASIMFWGLKRSIKDIRSIIPPLVFFTIPFVNTLSISQYSDIVLAFYLLGCFVCLIYAREEKSVPIAIISGLLCGAMSFTKTEGTLACLLIIGLSVPFLLKRPNQSWPLFIGFLTAAILSAMPAILFQLFWATQNVSFTNGLTSVDHPATFVRLKVIVMFLIAELTSWKWNGLWFLLGGGLFLGWKKCFKNGLTIIPIFLSIYVTAAIAHYFINTHYEIVWWLGTTLNRILYAILPLIVWWVFTAILRHPDKK